MRKPVHPTMQATKECIILRGVPGTGKTHVANMVFKDHVHCSADNFFERLALESGTSYEHVFEPRLLSKAHAECFNDFLMALEEGKNVVIANTNMQHWEFQNYLDAARIMGYETRVLLFKPRTRHQLRAFWKRNTHGVPWEVVDQMWKNFEPHSKDEEVETDV
jgi:predicted kinase